jgi:hypothetical protein
MKHNRLGTAMTKTISFTLIDLPQHSGQTAALLHEAISRLEVHRSSSETLMATLPFANGDTTGGTETEMQVAVKGRREHVDLPKRIEASAYFSNLLKRARSGDNSEQLINKLDSFLTENDSEIWENSGVRFHLKDLHPYARKIFEIDLLADKTDPSAGRRKDQKKFLEDSGNGQPQVCVPISYLIKLALADVIGRQNTLPNLLRQTGHSLLGHFLNDNTSPESFSFHVVPMNTDSGNGRALARETAKRFLMTHLLVQYANQRFHLIANGQKAMIYFAPHPPLRQKLLNDLIPDTIYRDLFMSPCLSGWAEGEKKHQYMHLCHQALSRSQLNAVAKLREAGIITNNLVVLPNLSNTSLANNGLHMSLGSQRLGALRQNLSHNFDHRHEKCLADLAIKIAEHFLPLFVGTYSAAPYRLDFADFHPERALGFLPHEVDYTHLRMLWRRWRKKADISFLGRSITPFGPIWLDRCFSHLLHLKGDCVPDFRLLDYPVCFLSTASNPALNGQLGNQERLSKDLASMGVADDQMSLYLFLKSREYDQMGFSGIEGRHYSLFESLGRDLSNAASLQQLIIALAYKYICTSDVTHQDIPDDPVVESERRQIFFGAAIDLPTFYVRQDSPNRLMQRILSRTHRTRSSRRYPGYLRVYNLEYRKTLHAILCEDAADLIEAMQLKFTLEDLKMRLDFPAECSAAGKLTQAILSEVNSQQPLKVPAKEFNQAAEGIYREDLNKRHLSEALGCLEMDLRQLEQTSALKKENFSSMLNYCLPSQDIAAFLKRIKPALLDGTLPIEQLQQLINLMLFSTYYDRLQAEQSLYGI